ncbi:MAG: hypothetical protein WCJ81_08980 [bacterium]
MKNNSNSELHPPTVTTKNLLTDWEVIMEEIKEDWEIEEEEDEWIEMYEKGIIELTPENIEQYNDLKRREIR